MWDRPDLLNRVTNVLYIVAGLAIAYGIVWTAVRLPYFALRQIVVTGGVQHITRAQVEGIVADRMTGTFFTLDLPRVRAAFEELPWVRQVNLRRHWPDRLEVNVVEHVPLARWGSTALVNTHGEVFNASYEGKLPTFVGPDGTSKEIAIQYDFFRRNLAPLSATPVLVQLTPRRAWQVRLDGGPTLELGRDHVEVRLARYVQMHERVAAALKRRVDYVDLRYANSFAVRVPELKGFDVQPERPAAKRVKRT